MNVASNLVIIFMFVALGVWVGRGYLLTRNKIVIKDRLWNLSRILFLGAGVFSMFTLLTLHTPLDILRSVITLAVVVLFVFSRDGIGEEGICSFGRFFPYQDVVGYDYKENKKDFSAYFVLNDGKARKSNEYSLAIPFEKDQEEAVKALLKKHIGRKYVRMKKS